MSIFAREKYKCMGIVIRQSFKATFVNYVGVVLGIFVQFYVVAKYLDPEVLGLTKVIYEAALLCSGFAMLSCNSVAMRFFPYFRDPEKHNNGFFFFYLLLPTVGSILLTGIYLLLKGPVTDYFGKNSALFNEYFYWVIPLMIILTFWQFFEGYANINMRIAIPKAIREVGMRLFMLVAYLLYGLGYVDVTGLVLSFIVAYGLCLVMTGTYSLHIGDNSLKHDWSFIKPDLRNKILKYQGFLILAAISGNIMNQLDVFMVSGLKGLYMGGIYTMAIYMAAVVEMPSRSITPISAPLAANAMKEGNLDEATKLYRNVSLHQFLASSVLLLVVWINLDAIFALIPNGDTFAAGKWAVLCLGLAKVINSTLNFGNTLISFSRYYYLTLFISIFITALTIGTNLYFIPLYGLTGAAIATLIACMVTSSCQQVIVQFLLKANPLTWSHLRVVAMVGLLYALNCLLPSLPINDGSVLMPIADIVMRSVVTGVVGLVLVYVLRVSPQINGMLKRFLPW